MVAGNLEVIFENIEQRILQEIQNAHYAIFVSVAWFTNQRLFEALVAKAADNCYVSIIVQLDEINAQSGIDYAKIRIGRSECFFISKEKELLHDKFCIIDFKTVITGSYNWTYKASHNSENILILSDPSIASQYISRFEQQKAKYQEVNLVPTSIPFTPAVPQCHVEVKILCPQCKRELPKAANYCGYCGELISKESLRNNKNVFCPRCRKYQTSHFVDAQSKYCSCCGSTVIYNS